MITGLAVPAPSIHARRLGVALAILAVVLLALLFTAYWALHSSVLQRDEWRYVVYNFERNGFLASLFFPDSPHFFVWTFLFERLDQFFFGYQSSFTILAGLVLHFAAFLLFAAFLWQSLREAPIAAGALIFAAASIWFDGYAFFPVWAHGNAIALSTGLTVLGLALFSTAVLTPDGAAQLRPGRLALALAVCIAASLAASASHPLWGGVVIAALLHPQPRRLLTAILPVVAVLYGALVTIALVNSDLSSVADGREAVSAGGAVLTLFAYPGGVFVPLFRATAAEPWTSVWRAAAFALPIWLLVAAAILRVMRDRGHLTDRLLLVGGSLMLAGIGNGILVAVLRFDGNPLLIDFAPRYFQMQLVAWLGALLVLAALLRPLLRRLSAALPLAFVFLAAGALMWADQVRHLPALGFAMARAEWFSYAVVTGNLTDPAAALLHRNPRLLDVGRRYLRDRGYNIFGRRPGVLFGQPWAAVSAGLRDDGACTGRINEPATTPDGGLSVTGWALRHSYGSRFQGDVIALVGAGTITGIGGFAVRPTGVGRSLDPRLLPPGYDWLSERQLTLPLGLDRDIGWIAYAQPSADPAPLDVYVVSPDRFCRLGPVAPPQD